MPRGLSSPQKTELGLTTFTAPVYCVRIKRKDGSYLRWSERNPTFNDGTPSQTYEARIRSIGGFRFAADEQGPITIILSNVDGQITTLDRAESFAGESCEVLAYLPAIDSYYIAWAGYCDEILEQSAESATLQAHPAFASPHVQIPARVVGIPCTHIFGASAAWVSYTDSDGAECPYQRPTSNSGFTAVLVGGINDSVTSLVADWTAGQVTAGAKFKKGDAIKIGTEKMLITNSPADPDGSGNQSLTVTRGYQGTTPASHSDTDPILFANCQYDTVACTRRGMYGNNSSDTYASGTKKRNYFGGFPFVVGYQYGHYRSKSGEKPKPLRLVFSGNESAYGRALPLVYGKVRVSDPILLLAKPEGDFLTTLWAVCEGVLATNTTNEDQTTPKNAYLQTSGVENIYVNGVSRHDKNLPLEAFNGTQDQAEPSSAFITGITDFSTNHLGFWGTARVVMRINQKNNPSVDLQAGSISGAFEIAYGRIVRVYTDPSTFTRKATTSPAWVLMDLMTSKRAGEGLDYNRLNRQSFVDWAAYCTANITSTFDGTTVERWTFNGTVDTRSGAAEWRHRICLGAYTLPPFLDKDGKLKVKALKSETLTGLPKFTSKSSSVTQLNYAQECAVDLPSAAWRLGEPSGTQATDSSGNLLHGTYQNSPTLGVTGALTGDADTAITLDGVNDHITVPDNSLLDPGDVFTLEAWVNPTDRAAIYRVFDKSANSYVVYIDGAGILTLAKKSVQDIAASTVAIPTGQWSHFAITKNGADVHIYVNGLDVTGPVTNATIVANSSQLVLGANDALTQFFKGGLDELRIYPTALSHARALQHYQTGKGNFRSVTAARNIIWKGNASGLVKMRRPIAEIPNEVRVNYVDRVDFAKVSLTVADRDSQTELGLKLGDQSRRAIVKSLDLPGVSTLDEAARLATLVLRAGEFGQGGLANNLKVRFPAFYRDAEDLEIGDPIEVEDDLLNAANGEQYFRVTAISNEPEMIEVEGGFVFTKEIEAVLHNNGIYDDTALTVSKYDRIDSAYPPDAEVPAVTSFGVSEGGIFDANNKPMTRLTFTWTDPSPKQNYKSVALHVTEDDGGGNPVENAWQYIGDLYNSGEIIDNFPVTNTRKHFCAASRAISGHAMDVSTLTAAGAFKYPRASVIVDGVTDALPAPGGLQIFLGQSLVTIRWNPYTGNDLKLFKAFRVYRNTVNDLGTATVVPTSGSTQDGHVFIDNSVNPSTTYYYWVKGVSVLNQEGAAAGPVNTTSAADAGADVDVPDAPVIGTVFNAGSFNTNEYSWMIGVDKPGGAANWNKILRTEIQVSPVSDFTTGTPFPAGYSYDGTQTSAKQPAAPTVMFFTVSRPGTYYMRARVVNTFGNSAWSSTLTRSTNFGDNISSDTDLMPAPANIAMVTAPTDPNLGGNEFLVTFEIPTTQAASYWGYRLFLHDSSTLPTATKQYDSVSSGTSGSLTAGVSQLASITASPGWTTDQWVGKDVVIFSPLRGGSPTWDYEGVIIVSKITANGANSITFDLPVQRQHYTLAGCKFFIVNNNAGHHFYEKLKLDVPPIINEGVTALTDERASRKRKIKFAAGVATVYAWPCVANLHGWGKVGSHVNATFSGITTGEIKLLAVDTGRLAAGAATAAKISVSTLDAITVNAGTITAGTFIGTIFKTASSGSRIEIDSTNGLRAYDSGGTLRTQIPVSGSNFGEVLTSQVTGVNSGALLLVAGNGTAQQSFSGTTIQVSSGGGVVLNITSTEVKPEVTFVVRTSTTERFKVDGSDGSGVTAMLVRHDGALRRVETEFVAADTWGAGSPSTDVNVLVTR
jgi:hypothetical protein